MIQIVLSVSTKSERCVEKWVHLYVYVYVAANNNSRGTIPAIAIVIFAAGFDAAARRN